MTQAHVWMEEEGAVRLLFCKVNSRGFVPLQKSILFQITFPPPRDAGREYWAELAALAAPKVAVPFEDGGLFKLQASFSLSATYSSL